MPALIIKAQGSKLGAKLAAMEKAAADTAPIYAAIGQALVTRIRICFKFGIDPWGSPWAPIRYRAIRRGKNGKASAVGRKQAEANTGSGSKGQPLVDTGRLRNSISYTSDATSVTVGTSVSFAKTHQFGAVIRPKNGKFLAFPGPNGPVIFAKKVTIPGRPFLPIRRYGGNVELPPAWRADALRTVKNHLLAAAEKAT